MRQGKKPAVAKGVTMRAKAGMRVEASLTCQKCDVFNASSLDIWQKTARQATTRRNMQILRRRKVALCTTLMVLVRAMVIMVATVRAVLITITHNTHNTSNMPDIRRLLSLIIIISDSSKSYPNYCQNN